jgi:poly(A) polymerase
MNCQKSEEFKSYLRDMPPLNVLMEIQEKFPQEIFLVGGIIRDFVLGRLSDRKCIEIDFAVEGDVRGLAKTFAHKVGENLVLLDEETQTFRVVVEGRPDYQFDFSQFREKNITQDLFLRDFTINAMALDLRSIKSGRPLELIDPYGGLKDIEKKSLHVLSERSFPDDPLRIIRAFNFSGNLGFKIEPDTIDLIRKHAPLLTGVAGERITEQLYKIFIHPGSCQTLKQMDEGGILEQIFPVIKEMRDVEQGPYHHLDIWRHSLETVKELETVLEEFASHDLLKEKIKNYLQEGLAGERQRIFILKLGSLFHDLGKPRAKEITPEGKIRFIGHEKIGLDLIENMIDRLKLSSREKNSLLKLINLHLRPGYLVDTQDISARAKLRFFRAAEEDSIALILLALADKRATRGPLTSEESQVVFRNYLMKVMEDYFFQKELVKPTRLLNGNEVMQILNISSGPVVGEILKELEEAQVENKVRNKKEAEGFIKALFKTQIGADKVELPRIKVGLPRINPSTSSGLMVSLVEPLKHRWAQIGLRTYFYNIATDRDRSLWSIPAKIFLSLFSLVYFLLIKVVLFLYENNYFKREELSLKIISVGNITWGGTGKTPLVEHIAIYLKQHGHKVAILTRGYKKLATRYSLLATSWEKMGDEAYMLAEKLRNIPVVVDTDRVRGIRRAIEDCNVDTVILDDGFQQWGIKKDLEIVAIDAVNPFGNGWLLGRGILREPISSLKRARIFFLIKVNLILNEKKNKIISILNRLNPSAMIIEAIYNPLYLKNLITKEEVDLNFLKGRDVCIFSGIASPDSFKATVEKLQCNIRLNFEFSDHYPYQKGDLDKIFSACNKNGIKILVTTEKDAVRIGFLGTGVVNNFKIFILLVQLNIIDSKEKFYARLSSLYQR